VDPSISVCSVFLHKVKIVTLEHIVATITFNHIVPIITLDHIAAIAIVSFDTIVVFVINLIAL
jgi:hypothetical protein